MKKVYKKGEGWEVRKRNFQNLDNHTTTPGQINSPGTEEDRQSPAAASWPQELLVELRQKKVEAAERA